MKNIKI